MGDRSACNNVSVVLGLAQAVESIFVCLGEINHAPIVQSQACGSIVYDPSKKNDSISDSGIRTINIQTTLQPKEAKNATN